MAALHQQHANELSELKEKLGIASATADELRRQNTSLTEQLRTAQTEMVTLNGKLKAAEGDASSERRRAELAEAELKGKSTSKCLVCEAKTAQIMQLEGFVATLIGKHS